MAQSNRNRQRAALAQTAVDAFAAAAGTTTEPRETNISDLITNLFHLCDRYDISTSRVLSRADNHYTNERAETDGPTAAQLLTAIEDIAALESGAGNPTDKLRSIKSRAEAVIALKNQ